MTREAAIAQAEAGFDTGAFKADLAALIAIPTDSTVAEARPHLLRYLDYWEPRLAEMGFVCTRLSADCTELPFLFAERIEDASLPTILTYGHGDTVPAMAGQWAKARDPLDLSQEDDLWFGRGIADNKGQHLINLRAISAVLEARGKLGFNVKLILEMGEEAGSPGLHDVARAEGERLKADLFLASDGPRLDAMSPTIFLGARGGAGFKLSIKRRIGGRHSGNFGGAIANPGIELANAIACIINEHGHLKIEAWKPKSLPQAARHALEGITPVAGEVDAWWGEPDLTPAERVHAWVAAEILAFTCGTPDRPVNAIPPEAHAWLQLRFVQGVDISGIEEALRAHLDKHGFDQVEITPEGPAFAASQTPTDHPFAQFIANSLTQTSGAAPVVLPSLGGSLPNDVFTDILGLPAVWVPHSYPACNQHAPDEHLPAPLMRQALGLMAGVFWDLGECPAEELGL